MNQNQRKMQMNRGLAIALAILVVSAIVITVIAVVAAKRSEPDPAGTTTESTSASTSETTTSKKDEPVIAEKLEFLAPVSVGTVIGPWSADIPVFSNTMEDYRVHTGVDIKAEAGTPVYAAADGTIEKAEFDPMMGQTVIISHRDGYKTVYRNLQTAVPEGIEAGMDVKAGDKIGTVGDTALVEIAEEPHLHFEIIKNDVSEDPMAYITVEAEDASADYED